MCPLNDSKIIEREEKRGDRLKGSAIHWLKKFNFQSKCDLVIDTEKHSIDQIVELILASLFLNKNI